MSAILEARPLPEPSPPGRALMSAMILAIAFAESIAIYALVIAFLMLFS